MFLLLLNHLINIVLLAFVMFVLSLIIYSFCFSLLFVSFFFFFFFSMANPSIVLKSKVVACMTNIDENCRNVCFESKVLNHYGTFDYLHSNNANKSLDSSTYIYLYCDLIDQECLTIITMTISENVVDHYEKKIHQGVYTRVENFDVRCKHSGGFQKETCHMHCWYQ